MSRTLLNHLHELNLLTCGGIFAYYVPAEVFVNCFITKFPGILSFFLLGAQSDVNTVCFADESGHLVYSGSDDTFCKVQIRYNFEDILLLFVKD